MTTNTKQTQNFIWDEQLIRKYDLSGPRYTSYPTAPQFNENFNNENWLSAIKRSNQSNRPLSLYFHIPFCDIVCYYCACNKIITANRKRAIPYLENLHKEITLQAQHVKKRPVKQLHWGGGTPTYINDEQMASLMDTINSHFPLLSDDSGEYSIEIHPVGVTPQRIQHLRALGFNRLSMGVQDFNEDVQQAVNRFNSEDQVAELIQAARDNQFHSLSVDLIYGLPLQTQTSFAETLAAIIELSPDRISLFNYAHMPEIFKTQRQINSALLPEPQEKLAILQQSIATLTNSGYRYIGMDHFAKPDDELALAQNSGQLHRNFQGYATHGNCDLLAFGVSSISSVDNTFSQNEKNLEAYNAKIEAGQLPINRGIELSEDDLIRREVIRQLICNFSLDKNNIGKTFNIEFNSYFAEEMQALEPKVEDGLVHMTDDKIQVNPAGRLLIRSICMTFDKYLKNQNTKPKFSRII